MNAQADNFDLVRELRVEDYLATVSYEVPDGYVPSDFSLGFVNFIKLVNGEEGEENMTPLVHYYMLDTLVSGSMRIANLCHRGLAKTTVMGEYLILYLAVYGELPKLGKVNFALYVSDSIENGVKNMRKNLEFRWERSEFLQYYIPNIRFTDIKWEFTNIDEVKFIVNGYGAKTGVRGTKAMGVRPQLAILDDLVSDEDARSATVIDKVEDTVYKAVEYALDPRRNMMIWSGTPFNARDPLYKAVESGAWAVNVFPVCTKYPCEERDFMGSWPDRFAYSYVKHQYEKAVKLGKVDTFNQELMLRIMSEEDRLILDNEILWYDSSSITQNKDRFNFYITTDFATSEKDSADFSVISVWAYNNMGQWFWVDGICKRQGMDKNIDDLFRLSQMYNPQQVGIEVSGQQGGFVPWIMERMMDRNVFFALASDKNSGAPGIRPNTNKMERFQIMVPMFKTHMMYFPHDKRNTPEMQEFLDEIQLASPSGFKSKNDDFSDTISMLSSLRPYKPTVQGEMDQEGDGGIWGIENLDSASPLASYIY